MRKLHGSRRTCEASPPPFGEQMLESLEEVQPIVVAEKDPTPVDPAQHDMMRAPGGIPTGSAGHASPPAGPGRRGAAYCTVFGETPKDLTSSLIPELTFNNVPVIKVPGCGCLRGYPLA